MNCKDYPGKKAFWVKDIVRDSQQFCALYKMVPSHEGCEYIWASAICKKYHEISIVETLLFASTPEGVNLNWHALTGSIRGYADHHLALNSIFYKIIYG